MIVTNLSQGRNYRLEEDVAVRIDNLGYWHLSNKVAVAEKLANEIGLTLDGPGYAGDVLIPSGTIIRTLYKMFFKIYASSNGVKIPENKNLPRGLMRLSYSWEHLEGKSVTPV